MTTPASWHPDPDKPGVERYWDGTAWTGQSRRAGSAQPSRPKWYRLHWVQLVAALLLGLGVGGAMGSSSAADAEKRADTAEAKVEEAQKAQAAAEQASSEAEANAAKAVAGKEADLAKQAAAIAAREKAVSGAEAAAEANTFDGDGVYLVGPDIQPGTYKSAGGASCYWARHDKANEILDNHLGSGPTVVVVRATDFSVEVKDCAEFRRAG